MNVLVLIIIIKIKHFRNYKIKVTINSKRLLIVNETDNLHIWFVRLTIKIIENCFSDNK